MHTQVTTRRSTASRALNLAVLVLACLAPAAVLASLKIVTLADLVQKSDVIARGSLSPSPSAGTHVGVASLRIASVLKGKGIAEKSDLPLCNTEVDSEHPDLAAVSGDYVIFAARQGECFHLVWGYDSLIGVRSGRASTAGIEDQPSEQPISQFLHRIRSLVRAQTRDAR
jgi:hypothetical protein